MTETRFYNLGRVEVEDFVALSTSRIISVLERFQVSVQLSISKQRIVVLLLVITTSSAAVTWFALKYVSNRPMSFERTGWMEARNRESMWVLNRMAKDLIGRRALIGESRSQLVEMLGEPERYANATDRQMFYLIRKDWDWIDPVRRDHLLISLDPNGRAVDARIVVFKKWE